MSRMHNPPHLGEIIKKDVLLELGITVTEAALQLICIYALQHYGGRS